jgi:hypothetical protein
VAFRGRQIVGPYGIVAAFPHGPHDLLTKRTAFRKRRIRFVAEAPKPFQDARHKLRRIGLVVVGHARGKGARTRPRPLMSYRLVLKAQLSPRASD